MTGAVTWHGRRGTVILGPTENRVAVWLADRTRHGRVTLRTLDLAAATGVERSEAYRITARLRVLGLFGIENDQGGTRGGRRFWRTGVEADGSRLDARRHHEAWARIVAWARARSRRLAARLAALHMRPTSGTRVAISWPPGVREAAPDPADRGPAPRRPGPTFLDRLVGGGLSGRLADDFGRGVQ